MQDEGRRHRRRGSPSAATASLLAEYQDAMRAELLEILQEIRGKPGELGLGMVAPEIKRPPVADRAKLWTLAIQLARELGGEIDLPPDPTTPADVTKPTRRRRPSFGPD